MASIMFKLAAWTKGFGKVHHVAETIRQAIRVLQSRLRWRVWKQDMAPYLISSLHVNPRRNLSNTADAENDKDPRTIRLKK
ncbi:MAG: hypothetical protein M1835_002902 [Candelina submexicana]|nr:MAG: hypothetical protein M1835_002902 [Candelina submexicana]